jgi:hypothetical protein
MTSGQRARRRYTDQRNAVSGSMKVPKRPVSIDGRLW